VLLGVALWIASIGLMEMQSLLMPPPAEYLQAFRALHTALAPANPIDALLSLAVIAVLPGLLEELVVRGVLLPSLASSMPKGAAVLVSATLFAAMHGDRYRLLFTFTIGVVLGLVRLWTDSLWTPVIAHISLNTLTFLVAPYVDDPSQPYTPQPVLGLACLLAGCVLMAPLLHQLVARPGAGRGGA
jgi:membrane protease YdiL (CAAX protease family)